MLRSEIDGTIDAARELAAERGFPLPEFAAWSRSEWLDQVDRLGPTLARSAGM